MSNFSSAIATLAYNSTFKNDGRYPYTEEEDEVTADSVWISPSLDYPSRIYRPLRTRCFATAEEAVEHLHLLALTAPEMAVVTANMNDPLNEALANFFPYHSFAETARNQLLADTRRLYAYKDGWNGPDSLGIPQATRDAAEGFIHAHDWDSLIAPDVSLSDEGEICFYWSAPAFKMDLRFADDKTYAYYAGSEFGRKYLASQEPYDKKLDSYIMDYIRK